MNEEEFNNLAAILAEYLETQKVFVQNPKRIEDVNAATETACRLFPEARIEIEDDPLQMGSLILSIEDFELTVRETDKFVELISKADNFEIFHCGGDEVRLAILFRNALVRI